jgi:hypothetical protein
VTLNLLPRLCTSDPDRCIFGKVCDGLYFGKLMAQFLCLMLLERKEEFESRSRIRECDVVLMYSGANCSQQGGAKDNILLTCCLDKSCDTCPIATLNNLNVYHVLGSCDFVVVPPADDGPRFSSYPGPWRTLLSSLQPLAALLQPPSLQLLPFSCSAYPHLTYSHAQDNHLVHFNFGYVYYH